MIKENIDRVKQRISSVCSRSNQNPHAITIVAVSKGRDLKEIQEVIESGITDIGENRVQEALIKYSEIRKIQGLFIDNLRWHLVGRLQSNKVKDAVRTFDLIQSVDSVELAGLIDRQAVRINKIQNILLEIKTSPEETKYGFSPKDAISAFKEIINFKNVMIKGVMTIAPLVENPLQARPYFKKLKETLDTINALITINSRLSIISMGMSDDFEVAIEEGSNMVRIGRAIFNS